LQSNEADEDIQPQVEISKWGITFAVVALDVNLHQTPLGKRINTIDEDIKMRTLMVFNNISLDGYFVDANGDMSWAYNVRPDPEFDAFVSGNAQGGGVLLFGRITYEMMAGYWPTEQARQAMPAVADGMNKSEKIVFSRTMKRATWNNTRLISSNMVEEVRKMKKKSGAGLVILGSGSIVSQLAQAGLIDSYQFVVVPVVLGSGRTMFEGIKEKLQMKLMNSHAFRNGKVVLTYETVK
jgi:dihydrofolate reductase